MKLLTLGNTKTVKGQKKGYMTFILHLAPSNLSGYNTCPKASKGCRSACLNTAGRGRFDNIQNARIRKTVMFFENRNEFMSLLVNDIRAAIRKAEREGFIPVFRLNGTSDIRWEEIEVFETDGKTAALWPNVMTMFPQVQFYDYTKLTNRTDLPKNYHLTFSRSESNEKDVKQVLSTNQNIAVVFGVKKGQPLPVMWEGRPVIDADEDDLRFRDPVNVISGLRAKGDAKKSNHNNFVVNV